MVRLDLITSNRQIDRLGEEWEETLIASGSDALSTSFGWITAWRETLGRNRSLLILRLRVGRETIGFVPLMFGLGDRAIAFSYRSLSFAPDDYLTTTADLIVTRRREDAIEKVLRFLSRRLVCGEVLLANIPEWSPNSGLIRSYLRSQTGYCELSHRSDVFRIEIAGRSWEEYLRTTSKSFVRKDIARLRNRYGERGWEVLHLGAAELEEQLQMMARLHILSQKRHGRRSYYERRGFLDFLRQLSRLEPQSPAMRIFLLKVGGVPAAYELGFELRGTFYSWDAGFDPQFERLSPSKFLMYEVLKSGFQRGWLAYDIGHGSGHYKSHWGCESYEIYQLSQRNGWGIGSILRNPFKAINGRRGVYA